MDVNPPICLIIKFNLSSDGISFLANIEKEDYEMLTKKEAMEKP